MAKRKAAPKPTLYQAGVLRVSGRPTPEREQVRAQAAAAERARIVAMLREEADHGPVGAGSACRYAADLIEREERP